MLKIRFFGSLRERLNASSFEYEYTGENTVSDVMSTLFDRGEQWLMLKEQDVLIAVNQTLSAKDAVINNGDEIAFFRR